MKSINITILHKDFSAYSAGIQESDAADSGKMRRIQRGQNKILAVLLCLTLVLLPVAGCAEKDSVTDSVDEYETVDETSETVLEVDKRDFGGRSFRMLTRDKADTIHPNLNTDELIAEPINDAIYNRNRKLENDYNITFTEILNTEPSGVARATILADSDEFDMITLRCIYSYELAAEGLSYPIEELENINLDRPYWYSSINDALTMFGRQYFAAGAFNLTSYDFTHMMLFNKSVALDYSIPNLYETVSNGEWTYDLFAEYVSMVSGDINGDSKLDENDKWGYLANGKQVLPCFWISAGTLSVAKDENDAPVFTAGSDERFAEVFMRIFEITRDTGAWYYNTDVADVPPSSINIFSADNALFMDCTFFFIEYLRNMESDFGILPYPKWNLEQDKYISRIEGCDLFVIPITVQDTDYVSLIIEALAAESEKSVIPQYYEVALKGKYSRDDESASMLDLIFSNRVFDFGDTIWCQYIRDGAFSSMYMSDMRNIASRSTALNRVVNKLIKDAAEAFG